MASTSAADNILDSIREVELPRDEEDPAYVKAFDVEDAEGIKAFFEEYGVVVVKDVLSTSQCEATIDDIWGYLETGGWSSYAESEIRRDDPSTWNNWPGMTGEGILGRGFEALPSMVENRANPAVFDVFGTLFGLDPSDLMVNHDRMGFFRPTALPGAENEYWETVSNIHLDMNPWVWITPEADERSDAILSTLKYRGKGDFIEENNHVGWRDSDFPLHVQGLINLADNVEADGGFAVVPGFHSVLSDWAEATTDSVGKLFGSRSTFIVLPQSSGVPDLGVRITARAGSLVCWNQRTAHGSMPNSSARPRIAQFLKVFPRSWVERHPARAAAREKAVLKFLLKAQFPVETLTPFQTRVLGLLPLLDTDPDDAPAPAT